MSSILTDVIRSDPEYGQLLRTVRQDFRAVPLPILASGLCEGAADALLISLLEDTASDRGGAALILCPEEKDCVRLGGLLERFGLRTGFYMARDLTFYNMTASHEYEHERIKVLAGLQSGAYDAVLTTPDAALAALLNLITGGGFAAMTGVFDVASVTAVRYNIESDGTLTLQEGSAGSILYENGTFRAGVYDVLSADKQTVTLLTVTFGADYDGSNYGKTYSVTVLVYYPQILTVKTNIAAIEGEIYRLGAFLDSPAFKIDISMGSSFSFLVEYAYSDAVENIDGFNFGKRIHSVLGDGKGNGRAFPAGTTVVLIDLNSASPAGFRYYTGVTEEDPEDENGACYLRFTGLTDVSGGGFSPRLLEAIRANGVYEEGHLYENESGGFTAAAVERYLMVVIPVEENCSTYQYNLKAEVEENDRNIVVEATENLCRISVWNEEGGSVSMDTDDTVFSNGEGGTLTATVTTEKPFSDGFSA